MVCDALVWPRPQLGGIPKAYFPSPSLDRGLRGAVTQVAGGLAGWRAGGGEVSPFDQGLFQELVHVTGRLWRN